MKHILIIDDNKSNLVAARSALSDIYKTTAVTSGLQALKFLENNKPDLVLLDINMPDMDGFETMREMRKMENGATLPIIFLTADNDSGTESKCLELGALDFISKPFVPIVMRSRIAKTLELEELRDNLEQKLEEKTREIKQIQHAIIVSFANIVETRDGFTGQHIKNTSRYVAILAKAMRRKYPDKLTDLYVSAMIEAAPLHDIGKISIPDSILCKPGQLTNEEFEVMRSHSAKGANVISDILHDIGPSKYLETAKDMANYHHEKWNGSGYPIGLKGEEIPLCARIMAVADVYDALRSRRCYKEGMSKEKSFQIIKDGSGTHFDPDIVQIFEENIEEIEAIGESVENNS